MRRLPHTANSSWNGQVSLSVPEKVGFTDFWGRALHINVLFSFRNVPLMWATLYTSGDDVLMDVHLESLEKSAARS